MSDWISTLGLIFGGCCSNAISLEQITSKYPDSGTLITFFQFLLISLHGLPRQIEFSGGRFPYPKLKPRKIPFTPYLVQMALFYLVSLLNNIAFGYAIPMPVHIIFRSGGLIVSIVLGYMIVGKRYSFVQILSVIVVTLGVAITTISASRPKSLSKVSASPDVPTKFGASYAMGIIILSLALILSGLLGLAQDWTFSRYKCSSADVSSATTSKINGTVPKPTVKKPNDVPSWQESLFYLHFLALPMFFFVREDLTAQFLAIHAGPKFTLPLSLSALHQTYPILSYPLVAHPISASSSLSIPVAYFPLLLNTLTQLLCASGVHRLTGKVSSLTVTLTLVVRKAVSLVISVLLYGGDGKGNLKMWAGAVLVLVGTVGYSMGARKAIVVDRKKKE